MMLALEIFFWIIIGVIGLGALFIGVMVLLANMMSDNASDNQPTWFDRLMEHVTSILRRGNP